MEYLVLSVVLAGFVVLVLIRETVQARAAQKRFIESLYQGFGELPHRKDSPESYAHVTGFYKRHPKEGQIDDITWNDLNMDAVFQRLNYCLSATGEEYLYYMLRTVGALDAELSHLEETVRWFAEHADARVQVQCLMHKIGHTGKYSLYDYIDNLDDLGERTSWKHHLANLLFLPLVALLLYQPAVAICGLLVLIAYQIVTYFKDKGQIEPYIISFAYVIRLLQNSEKLCRLELPPDCPERADIEACIRELQGVRRGSSLVFSSVQPGGSGNPLDLIMDYIKMIFHVDLILFNKMLRQLCAHRGSVDVLIARAGFLEAAISVSAYRASLKSGWCVPELIGEGTHAEESAHAGEGVHAEERAYAGEGGILLEDAYHPLVEGAVKNTIRTERGVLVTGSNASGKSTFLKTVALNAILAQTIHTCTAGRYVAPYFRIYSSMALRDDLDGGESYYIVEIKSLKRILDAAKGGRILCFVDEVLRGTNTVERIAASTEILKSLAGQGILCFAATHDIELTETLKSEYENYHFEEEIREGDIVFSYSLKPGKATTRNAIRLLEIMGYEPQIVERAGVRAQRFLDTGIWK